MFICTEFSINFLCTVMKDSSAVKAALLAVLQGRDADALLEAADEVGAVAKAALEAGIGDGGALREQPLGKSDLARPQICVEVDADLLLEEGGQIGYRQPEDISEHRNRGDGGEVFVDVGENLAASGGRKLLGHCFFGLGFCGTFCGKADQLGDQRKDQHGGGVILFAEKQTVHPFEDTHQLSLGITVGGEVCTAAVQDGGKGIEAEILKKVGGQNYRGALVKTGTSEHRFVNLMGTNDHYIAVLQRIERTVHHKIRKALQRDENFNTAVNMKRMILGTIIVAAVEIGEGLLIGKDRKGSVQMKIRFVMLHSITKY